MTAVAQMRLNGMRLLVGAAIIASYVLSVIGTTLIVILAFFSMFVGLAAALFVEYFAAIVACVIGLTVALIVTGHL